MFGLYTKKYILKKIDARIVECERLSESGLHRWIVDNMASAIANLKGLKKDLFGSDGCGASNKDIKVKTVKKYYRR